MDLHAWLAGLGLQHYAEAFAQNDIDAAMLAALTDADLKELGVASLGHRKRILAAIAARGGGKDEAVVPPIDAAPLRLTPEEGERRQATILFADLCGFTALSRTLDPEELHHVVSRFTALCDGIVESYGGTVDKHIGDAVMALFGAPVAHDDDPLRAARAALDIHAALTAIASELGRPLEAHLGIASGEVVAGGLSRGGKPDYTVLGDSVNLAARLVSLAKPGETLISDAARRALADRVACQDLGEVAMKGLDRPERVWRLMGLASAGSARGRFIGRRAEREQLRAIITACRDAGIGQAVYIRGEAGIGKTRLVEEAVRLAGEQGFAPHKALVLDFGVGKDEDPVRALARSLLAIEPGSSEAVRRVVADRAVVEGILSPDQNVFLNDLLDLPQSVATRALYDAMENSARNRGKQEILAALVDAASRRQPILITVEDLHWADATTLSYLAALAAAIRNGPSLLVMTSRSEGDPINSAWRAATAATPLTTIDLGRLREDEAFALARGLIDARQSVALACIERAGGNPLFLEQLLRHAEDEKDEAVPASIQSLVLARLDRLPPGDKHALQAASIIGQRFAIEALRHLTGIADYACMALLEHALVRPDGEGFIFAHALIQEAVYSSLLKVRRRELHRKAALWFAEQDPVLRAQHLDRAEDAAAAGAYRDAAEAQKALYHYDRALRLAERGLEIAQIGGDRHALLCLKGELLHDLGDIAGSIEIFRSALAASADDIGGCRAHIGLAAGLRVSEGLDEALSLLDAAEAMARRSDLVGELARIHHLRGNIYFPLGRIEGCREQHELGLAAARRSGSPEAEARALGGLADAAYAQGRMRSAFEHFSRCVALSRQHGFGRIEVANRSMVGFSRHYLNELAEALADGIEAARSAAQVGHQRAEMLGETMAVFACVEMGDFTQAATHLAREMQLIRRLGARRFEAQNIEMQGRVLLAQGRRGEAVERLKEALALCREVGMQFSGPKAISALALATEDPAEARTLFDEGRALLARGAVGHCHLWFHRDAIEAKLQAQDWAGARAGAAALDAYTRDEPLPWAELFIARAHALAAAGSSADGIEIHEMLENVRADLASAKIRPYLAAVELALAAGHAAAPARE